jgi:hypothetical protein
VHEAKHVAAGLDLWYQVTCSDEAAASGQTWPKLEAFLAKDDAIHEGVAYVELALAVKLSQAPTVAHTKYPTAALPKDQTVAPTGQPTADAGCTIGAMSSGSCVYYEVCGASTDNVEFGYRSSTSTGQYVGFPATYSSITGKWTSACWTAGNPNYELTFKDVSCTDST